MGANTRSVNNAGNLCTILTRKNLRQRIAQVQRVTSFLTPRFNSLYTTPTLISSEILPLFFYSILNLHSRAICPVGNKTAGVQLMRSRPWLLRVQFAYCRSIISIFSVIQVLYSTLYILITLPNTQYIQS